MIKLGNSVSVYFSKELLAWLNEEARKERRSRSELVRIFLEDIRSGRLVRKEEVEERASAILRRAY